MSIQPFSSVGKVQNFFILRPFFVIWALVAQNLR